MFTEGQSYSERYRLVTPLGHGGTGEVWLARDTELEIDVALKFLKPCFSEEDTEVLKRETRQARMVTHPHILPVYDFAHPPGERAAISMEYAPGGSVGDLIPKRRPFLEIREISNWMLQACEALSYLHGQCGIVHRDVKPGNFMLDAANRLKLADFGLSSTIAAQLDAETRETIGTRLTMPYASPQQARNPYESDPSNDIYAMGVSIYYLLTGKYPFSDPKRDSWKWDEKNILSIGSRRKGRVYSGEPIPQSWDYAVSRCLSEDPADRPTNAGELAELLKADDQVWLQTDVPQGRIELAPPSTKSLSREAESDSKSMGRRKGVAILLVALIGLLVGIAWGTMAVLAHREPPEKPPKVERVNEPNPFILDSESTLGPDR